MDVGCGSGKVYAVDVDSNMIVQAKRNLKDLENVESIQSDILDVKLPTKLDIIFSKAVLHWLHDRTRVLSILGYVKL